MRREMITHISCKDVDKLKVWKTLVDVRVVSLEAIE